MRAHERTLLIAIGLAAAAGLMLAACTTTSAQRTTATSTTSEAGTPSPMASYAAIPISSGMRAGLTLNRPFEPVAVYQFQTHRDDPSVSAEFSGLSSLRLLETSERTLRFEVVSDSAHLGAIEVPNVMNGNLASNGRSPARMIALRGVNGELLQGNSQVDAEGLAPTANGRLISLERNHRLLHLANHALNAGGPTTAGPQLTGFEGLEPNGGMEALARLPDGRYLASAEYGRADQGQAQALKPPYWIFALDQKGAISPHSSFENVPGFGITEARVHANRLWLLKRSWVQQTNVTTVRLESCSLETVIAARPVCTHDMTIAAPFPIDNYEGLEILTDPKSGDHYFFILSDDNVSAAQKTLLLSFRLPANALTLPP